MGYCKYFIIIITLLLLAFTVLQEYKRVNKKYSPVRMVVACLAAISLACIALPISFEIGIASNNGEVIIETDGYNTDSINNFLKSESKIPVYSLSEYETIEKANYSTVHVFGYGLFDNELQLLNGARIVFHPSLINKGIISANWKHVLQKGDKLTVQGMFVNTSIKKIKLVLSGLSSVLDSITIQPNTNTNFELSTVPKNTGKAVYALSAVDDDKTMEEEFVPFDVRQPDSLAVLVLAASPDFEDRFLKSWLSQNAFSVTSRTAISKGKFDKAFLNTSITDVDKITNPFLGKFDVVITDASAFAGLSKDEQHIIQSKVEEGLGLIVKTDTVMPSAFYAAAFPLYAPDAKSREVAVKLADENKHNTLPAEQPVYIKPMTGAQTVATDSSTQILASANLYGQGKILLTTINNSYSWVLAGNAPAYDNYWSLLIDKASRKKTQSVNIGLNQTFPRVNQQLLLKAQTAGGNIPNAVIGGSHVYCKQSIDLPFEWQATYWPMHTGWQTATVNNAAQDFYVYDANDWRYVAAAQKLEATKQYVLKQNRQRQVKVFSTTTEQANVPKIYFFLAFILCCTVLWVEKKFNG